MLWESLISRKLVLWKCFEISEKGIVLTKLLSFIFGIIKPLLITFFNRCFFNVAGHLQKLILVKK